MGLKDVTNSVAMVVSLLPLLLLPVTPIVEVEAAFERTILLPCSLRDPMMDPNYNVRHGHDVVWQIPANPKAVLLFAHGHGMNAFEYFDPGPNCEQCYGMPEPRTVVLDALRRRYAVIVVTVVADGRNVDAPIVCDIVKEWMAEHMLDFLPLAVWGHSAGTSLATALSRSLSMQAIVLMCGAGSFQVEEAATPQNFPPVLFATMAIDQFDPLFNQTGEDITRMAVLSSRGVEVAYTELWPKPLSPLFFTDRIRCMSKEMSVAIYAAYEAAGWLDGNGYLTRDPNDDDWQSVLWEAKALPFCPFGDRCLAAQVGEELTMAFAKHSFTSDGNDLIFPWLESFIHSSSRGKVPVLQSPALTATI